jgi:hypothetical protein
MERLVMPSSSHARRDQRLRDGMPPIVVNTQPAKITFSFSERWSGERDDYIDAHRELRMQRTAIRLPG